MKGPPCGLDHWLMWTVGLLFVLGFAFRELEYMLWQHWLNGPVMIFLISSFLISNVNTERVLWEGEQGTWSAERAYLNDFSASAPSWDEWLHSDCGYRVQWGLSLELIYCLLGICKYLNVYWLVVVNSRFLFLFTHCGLHHQSLLMLLSSLC